MGLAGGAYRPAAGVPSPAVIPWHVDDGTLRVHKLCVGPLENNVYVVACARTGKSVVIDAAAEPERIVGATAGTQPLAVLTTHGHPDHVGAATAVCRELGVPFRIHHADAALAGIAPDLAVEEEEEIAVGDLVLQALHTPGHTPGSTCFLVGNHLFSGDTLFPGGPGATGNPAAFSRIVDSLRMRLFTLDDATLVHPGHGLDTTIGAERPQLDGWVTRGY